MYIDHAAQKNHKRAHDLMYSQTPSFLDWEITTLFYAALHLIDQHLKDLGIHEKGHGRRLRAVKYNLPKMYDPYETLYAMSMTARYNGAGAVDEAMSKGAKQAYAQVLRQSV